MVDLVYVEFDTNYKYITFKSQRNVLNIISSYSYGIDKITSNYPGYDSYDEGSGQPLWF